MNRHVIKQWVSAGLLPRAVRHPAGWGPPRISQPVDCGRQLLALCSYRYDQGLGRHDVIGGNLWLDGYSIPVDTIRRATIWALADAEAQNRRAMQTRELEDAEQAIAYALARDPMATSALPGVSLDDRQALIHEVADRLRTGGELTDWAKRTLGKTMGLSVRQVEGILGQLLLPIGEVEVVSAVDLPEEDLLRLRSTWIGNPALAGGIERVRSHRTRSVRRFIAFNAFVVQVQPQIEGSVIE